MSARGSVLGDRDVSRVLRYAQLARTDRNMELVSFTSLPERPLLWCLPSVPLSLCPSVPLSLCPSVPLSLCPSVPLSLCPSVPSECGGVERDRRGNPCCVENQNRGEACRSGWRSASSRAWGGGRLKYRMLRAAEDAGFEAIFVHGSQRSFSGDSAIDGPRDPTYQRRHVGRRHLSARSLSLCQISDYRRRCDWRTFYSWAGR